MRNPDSSERQAWPGLRPVLTLAAAALLSLQLGGCAAGIGAAAISSSAGSVAGAGIEYSFSGTARKTFTRPVAEVREATRDALKRMGFTLETDRQAETGRRLTASAARRDIEIDLERLSDKATVISVKVQKGNFLNDQTTASELIVQCAKILEIGQKAA